MSVLAALAAYCERLAARGEPNLPPQGYMVESISFVLDIEHDGAALNLMNIRVAGNRGKQVGRSLIVPKLDDHSNALSPFLFWDNSLYAIGVTKRALKNRTSLEYFEAFKRRNLVVLEGCRDEGAAAFRAFLESWSPDQFEKLGFDNEAQDQNIVFRLRGERRFLHEREAFKRIWEGRPAPERAVGQCLVTGEEAPIVATHPSLGGVAGAQGAGAAIVSFNAPAFTSFGKEQGANAPVSVRAAFAYTTALNALLANARRRIRVGDATAVFWAEAGETSKASTAAEDMFAAWLDPGGDDPDIASFSRLRATMEAIADGCGWPQSPNLDARIRLHFLGLSPNNARLALRFWHVGSLGDFAGRLVAHYRDLDIEPAPFARPPKFGAWLFETAVQRKAENIPPSLGGEFMRAILSGGRYPRTLLAAVIGRVRADGVVNGARAALCKAVIQRQRRLCGEKEDVPVSLDKDNANPAYRLGRLFALYEWAEEAAENRTATIRDKFFAAASATPARVFPLLMRGSTHNLSKLRKGGKGGLAVTIDREIAAVMDGLPDPLPKAFPLEEQGRFVVGYYHQEQARFAGKKTETAAAAEED